MTRIFIRDLTPGTDYALQLRTDAGDSVSNWSRLFPLTTIGDTDAPDAVAWIDPEGSAWIPDGNAFVAKWVAINPALPQNLDFSHYEISFTDNTTTFTRKLTGTSYVLTYEENKAMFGTPAPLVKAKVRAVDQTGNTSAYNTELTANNAAPLAPTGVTADAVADGIKISWTDSTSDDVVGYNIYIGTTTAPTTKVAFTTSNPYTYTSLTFVEQFVRVRAVDIFGQESPYSNEDSATPESPFVIDTTAPAAPTAFDAVISNQDTSTVITRQVATLTWTHPGESDLAGFHIRFRKTGTTSWAILNANPEAREFFVTLPEPFVGYDFEIRSYDLYTNKSAWVSDNPAAVTTYTPPQFIQDLIIGGGGSIESANFATGISGFRIDEDSIIINEGLVSGSVITTGIIHSTEPALDSLGDPITGEFAWQIDLEGDAVFGDTKIRGSMVVGFGETEGDQLSIVQSANYIPGESGWMLRSDGTVEFRSIVDNSINGSSIEAGTISVATLAAGDLDANINLLSNITATGEMGEEVTFGAGGFMVLGPDEVVLTNKAVASGVATLTTATEHGFRVGNKILVITGDTLFDGQFIIDTIPTTTTFTFATSVADFTSAAITGIVKGRDYTGLNNGPKYVEFPTDGTQPNIISGQLTADKLTITGGATFRGISGIELGAELVIDNDVLAPKNAPVSGVNYNDVAIQDIPTGSVGNSPEAKRTIYGATLGHTGNLFVLGSAGQNNYSLTEHNPITGELINTIWDVAQVLTAYQTMRGIAYSSTRSRYYVYYQLDSRAGNFQSIQAYDTTFAAVGDSFTLGSKVNNIASGEYLTSITKGTIGWDHTNDVLMWVGQTAPEADPRTRTFTHDATTGAPNGLNANIFTLGNTDVFNSPAYIARGSFDLGTSRIVYRDRVYSTVATAQTGFRVYPNLGGLSLPYESWPAPYNTTTMAAYWDSTNSKFSSITGADMLCELQGGDSYWGRTYTITNKELTSNVATLTTSAAHDFRKGMTVVVSGVDATFNGTFTVTSVPTSTTFTYAKTASNVTSQASGGSVFSNYSGIRWLGYSWYDNVGTTHETNLSPRISVTLPKRAIHTITIAPIPFGTGGVDSPKQARVYTSRQTTDPGVDGTEWHLCSTISYPSTMGKNDPEDADSATTPSSTNTFLLISTTPGQIKSSTGNSFWKGDDTAQFFQMVLTSTSDVNANAGNKPALRVGNVAGTHLRVDGNEIQAMTGDAAVGSMFLNNGGGNVGISTGAGTGGTVTIGESSRPIKTIRFGVHTGNSNASGQTTTGHSMGVKPDVVVITPLGAGTARAAIWIESTSGSTNFIAEHRKLSDGTLLTSSTADFAWIAIAF